jgi:hypothetical protein
MYYSQPPATGAVSLIHTYGSGQAFITELFVNINLLSSTSLLFLDNINDAFEMVPDTKQHSV